MQLLTLCKVQRNPWMCITTFYDKISVEIEKVRGSACYYPGYSDYHRFGSVHRDGVDSDCARIHRHSAVLWRSLRAASRWKVVRLVYPVTSDVFRRSSCHKCYGPTSSPPTFEETFPGKHSDRQDEALEGWHRHMSKTKKSRLLRPLTSLIHFRGSVLRNINFARRAVNHIGDAESLG